MKAAITDDLAADRQKLNQILHTLSAEAGFSLKVHEFTSGEELLSSFAPSFWDVIFLDICMKGVDGMETARRIRELDGRVKLVFVTGSSDYAVESYRVDCSFYLVKPFHPDEVHEALLHCRLPELDRRTVCVVSGRLPVTLHAASILFAERTKAAYRTIRISLSDNSFVDTRMPFEDFAPLLLRCGGFCLSNRSCIVNVAEISRLTDNEVTLSSGCVLPVSRSKSSNLKEAYSKYLFARTRGEAYP